MSSPRDDFAVLLAAPNPTKLELAQDLLASAGIPSIVHGQDRGFAGFGVAGHAGISGPDLLVPKSALERARALLEDAWGDGSLDERGFGSRPR